MVRKERLEEWLDRELTAILGTDDVALVRMYVLGVLSAEQGQHVMQSVTRVAPVEALQPFLATAAAHFWHELRWADENRPLQQSFSACLCCSRSGDSAQRQACMQGMCIMQDCSMTLSVTGIIRVISECCHIHQLCLRCGTSHAHKRAGRAGSC